MTEGDWLTTPDGARRVSVSAGPALELDPDLGSALSDEDREAARRECRVEVVRVAPGPWSPQMQVGGSILALVVLDGILLRQTSIGRHERVELLASGDVVLPPASPDGSALTEPSVASVALEPLRLMVLGPSFLRAALRWPGLLTRVRERLARQQSRVVAQGLALQEPRAEDRILLTLWLLGERCGRMTSEGLMLPLQFTHESLSRITAARRPTVSLALKQLEGAGLLLMREDGRTVLTQRAADVVRELTAAQRDDDGSSWTLVPPRTLDR